MSAPAKPNGTGNGKHADTNPNGRGRPSKLTKKRMARLKLLLSAGMPQCRAAEKTGIHRATFQSWLAAGRDATSGEYRDFYVMVQDAIEKHELKLLGSLEGLSQKDYRALLYSLTMLGGEDYSPPDALRGVSGVLGQGTGQSMAPGLGGLDPASLPAGTQLEVTTTLKIVTPKFLDAPIEIVEQSADDEAEEQRLALGSGEEESDG